MTERVPVPSGDWLETYYRIEYACEGPQELVMDLEKSKYCDGWLLSLMLIDPDGNVQSMTLTQEQIRQLSTFLSLSETV